MKVPVPRYKNRPSICIAVDGGGFFFKTSNSDRGTLSDSPEHPPAEPPCALLPTYLVATNCIALLKGCTVLVLLGGTDGLFSTK